MLKKAADELLSRYGADLGLSRRRFLVFKGDPSVVELEDPVVGDGHSKDVRSQVLESFQSTADGFRVDDPVFLPHLFGHKVQ